MLAAFSAAVQMPVRMVTVEGYLTGVEDGTAITMVYSNGNVAASDTVRDGRFTLRAAAGTGPRGAMILYDSNNPTFPDSYLMVYIEADKTVTVRGNDKYISGWEVGSDIPEQIQANVFAAAARDILIRIDQLDVESNELYETIRERVRMLDDQGVTDIDQFPEEIKRVYERRDSLSNLQSHDLQHDLSLSNIGVLERTEVTPFWLGQYANELEGVLVYWTGEDLDIIRPKALALYSRIPAEMLDTEKGKEVSRMYSIIEGGDRIDFDRVAKVDSLPTAKEGGPAADMDFFDLDGNIRRLSEFRGSYVILDFWAHWCGPCVMAMPELREVAEEYAGKLVAVSISQDTEKQWRKASANHNITWQNFNAGNNGGAIWGAYGINGIPHYVVIDPDGTVVMTWSGYGKGLIKERLSKALPAAENN